MAWYPVAKVGDVRPGDVLAVSVAGSEIVIGIDGDRYFALQRRCVHRGGDLAEGIVARGHVVCANHGWRFSTASGQHDTAADVCLITYPIRITGTVIEVDPTPSGDRGEQ